MNKVGISELVLRDAHQSLHATRMTTADMLPICEKLDKVGYKFIEGWGGATYDSCIRFLNEDPWERLRALHKALPNNKIMMLLRGQNLLGYRHYADDIVDKFVELAAKNGVEVFRIFDACNDPRNLERATKAAKKTSSHVQMAISYAVTPYHTIEKYAELAKTYAEFGADSICIKDMSGLLKPYVAYKLVKAIKDKTGLPVEIHTHSTTGLSVATLIKGIEGGADIVDTAISSMAMGTSHSPTETIVEALKDTEFDTGLDTKLLLEIAAYFREVRRHYASLESKFLGADTRILLSQVPGGMLSNLESQLKQQGAANKMDKVLEELPIVQKDVGYVPLVTPTSQIVGTQAVFNVLFGRYVRMTGEFRDLLTGKYGRLPAAPNKELVKKALVESKMEKEVTCRPADLLAPEWDKMVKEAQEAGGNGSDEDVLTYAMFPKVAANFFKSRSKGAIDAEVAFGIKEVKEKKNKESSYTVSVNGASYAVNVVKENANSIDLQVNGTQYSVSFKEGGAANVTPGAVKTVTKLEPVTAPVAGTVLRYSVKDGEEVKAGETILILESMKMELEVKSSKSGVVKFSVAIGDNVTNGAVIANIEATTSEAQTPPTPSTSSSAEPSKTAISSSTSTSITAPVAGTLLRYAVNEGESVKEGDTVLILESMKMELEIKAGVTGAVHFIAALGSQITQGQVLAEVK